MTSGGERLDCWKRIGVHGDSSCEVLHDVEHCHYCNVYRSTATYVLDKPASLDYIDEATRLAAEPLIERDRSYVTQLVFRVGEEWLALSSAVCQEVAARGRPHSIPGKRDGYIVGLVNVRGELLIQVALEQVLGIGSGHVDQSTLSGAHAERLVVIQKQGDRFAFLASEIHGLVRSLWQELVSPPDTLARAEPHYTSSILQWNGKSVSCLDDELLFYTLNKGLA
jgi:chemotaxis-related protein WspD